MLQSWLKTGAQLEISNYFLLSTHLYFEQEPEQIKLKLNHIKLKSNQIKLKWKQIKLESNIICSCLLAKRKCVEQEK